MQRDCLRSVSSTACKPAETICERTIHLNTNLDKVLRGMWYASRKLLAAFSRAARAEYSPVAAEFDFRAKFRRVGQWSLYAVTCHALFHDHPSQRVAYRVGLVVYPECRRREVRLCAFHLHDTKFSRNNGGQKFCDALC